CLKSSRRAGEVGLLVVDMASPTTTARLGSLQRGSTHGHKVMGDDAPADVSFKANLTLIKSSLHPKAVFERAKARFNACSPALTTLAGSRDPALIFLAGVGASLYFHFHN